MAVFPHSKLFLGSEKTIVISGSHIQVLNSKTGKTLCSTTTLEDDAKEALLKAGPIRCAAVDEEFVRVVTSGDDKKMKVWQVEGLKLLSERELPKKPTHIAFTRNGQTILVSDKFGDVVSYPLTPDPTSKADPALNTERDTASHENSSGGTLVLGHTSLLTSFLLSVDEKYILTADRDEHIRVSWYPQGYCIESYCLGHKKFVSAIHIPKSSPNVLMSGGGDPVLKVWDWMTGRLFFDIPIGEVVEPYIKVRAKKRKWGDDEDGEGGGEHQGKGKKVHGRKGRKKNQKNTTEATESVVEEKEETPGVGQIAGEVGEEPEVSETKAQGEGAGDVIEPVLVINRIETLRTGETKTVVFSAVGATALFWCSFPDVKSSPPSSVAPQIFAHDFGKPIVDIALDSPSANRIWVLLDAHWQPHATTFQPPEPASSSEAVKLVHLSSSSITELDAASSPLLPSLNTSCILPSTPEDLTTLDLYGLLSSMPKNVEVQHNPMNRDGTSSAGGGQTGGKKLNAKQLAKAMTRKAILQKTHGHAHGKGGELEGSEVGDLEERESKKPKSDAGIGNGDGAEDVTMDEP